MSASHVCNSCISPAAFSPSSHFTPSMHPWNLCLSRLSGLSKNIIKLFRRKRSVASDQRSNCPKQGHAQFFADLLTLPGFFVLLEIWIVILKLPEFHQLPENWQHWMHAESACYSKELTRDVYFFRLQPNMHCTPPVLAYHHIAILIDLIMDSHHQSLNHRKNTYTSWFHYLSSSSVT